MTIEVVFERFGDAWRLAEVPDAVELPGDEAGPKRAPAKKARKIENEGR